jgi:hypothetical protein
MFFRMSLLGSKQFDVNRLKFLRVEIYLFDALRQHSQMSPEDLLHFLIYVVVLGQTFELLLDL